jgi:hypothetical protein
LQHGGDVLQIFGADLLRFGVGIDVVVAIRQAEAAGGGESDDAAGVGEILRGAEREQARVAGFEVHAGEQCGKVRGALQGGDFIEARLERFGAGLFDGGFIHAGGEVVADFLLQGSALGGGFGGFVEDAPEVALIVVGELGVDVPAGLVGRDGVQLVPVAAGEFVEVDAGVGGAVEEAGFQAGGVGQEASGWSWATRAMGMKKQNGAHGEKGITGAWEAELDFAGGAAE